jgi:hypothetical protein
MATITLVANTNYSALGTLANGDTIDCAGFQLTVNQQPTHTNISVVSPATAGTVAISGAYSMPTWSFVAGTAGTMISSVPSGCTIGACTAGTASNAFCVNINSGTISGTCTGGSGTTAIAVVNNNGTILGDCTGGTNNTAHAVNTNSGTISGTCRPGNSSGRNAVGTNNGLISGACLGGATATTQAVGVNSGTITGAVTGGSAAAAVAITTNSGTITGLVTGGSNATANGVQTNSGVCVGGLTNGTAPAVGTWRGTMTIVDGPASPVTIPSTITVLYSLFGAMHAASSVSGGTAVTVLQTGGGILLPRAQNGGYSA